MKEKPNEIMAKPLVKIIDVSEKMIVENSCKFPMENFSKLNNFVIFEVSQINLKFLAQYLPLIIK